MAKPTTNGVFSPVEADLRFSDIDERQFVDLLVRFPHRLASTLAIWKQDMGFRSPSSSMFTQLAYQLLVDSVGAYFQRAVTSGDTVPDYYLFSNGEALRSCLVGHAAANASTYLDTDTLVSSAWSIYASPTHDIGPTEGKARLDMLWRPFIIHRSRLRMAACIQAGDVIDERKIMQAVDSLRGSSEEVLFESARDLFYNAVEQDVQKHPTGFTPLDTALEGGLEPDSNMLLFGNNGAGKSTIACQFGIWMARRVFRPRGKLVVYVSSEQPSRQHFQSMMGCTLELQKGVIKRHFQNPKTTRHYLDTIHQQDRKAKLEALLQDFLDTCNDTMFFLRFPKKGAVNLADWLPIKLMELQQKHGKPVGAVVADWFGRTFCGKPDEARLVGEMNVTADRLTTMMDSDGGFNANLIVLAQATASGYGTASLKATDIGNAKNITDSFETVAGITTMMAPPAMNEDGELSSGDRKRYREFQLLNLVKTRFGEPCDIPFRRDYANSRILPVNESSQ